MMGAHYGRQPIIFALLLILLLVGIQCPQFVVPVLSLVQPDARRFRAGLRSDPWRMVLLSQALSVRRRCAVCNTAA